MVKARNINDTGQIKGRIVPFPFTSFCFLFVPYPCSYLLYWSSTRREGVSLLLDSMSYGGTRSVWGISSSLNEHKKRKRKNCNQSKWIHQRCHPEWGPDSKGIVYANSDVIPSVGGCVSTGQAERGYSSLAISCSKRTIVTLFLNHIHISLQERTRVSSYFLLFRFLLNCNQTFIANIKKRGLKEMGKDRGTTKEGCLSMTSPPPPSLYPSLITGQ